MRRESNTIIQSLGQDMNGVSDSNTSRPLYRPRQLEKEMRLLAKKEAAARNEKTDMLRSEIANTALTKQRLMQDAMERRKRRTGKRRNRSISMDSDTESAYEEDSILSVNSHHSNSDGKMLTIMENANDVKVINTQHQNTSHKLNVTSALVAKFESSQLTKKNQLNQQEKVPLTITTSTTINTKTEEPKNQHKPPVKNGVALLIAKYDTTKNTPSTSTTSTNVSNTVNKSVINTTKLPFIPNTTDILMDKSIASNSSNLTVTPLLEMILK
ncbi:hypothetical protein BDF19DRAFT_41975 [Syncephalis fuscata]|nr:hypothetical protein BDF19DRAFT_41975 [Syncephalis fuscata]